jgi:hypothetical protein
MFHSENHFSMVNAQFSVTFHSFCTETEKHRHTFTKFELKMAKALQQFPSKELYQVSYKHLKNHPNRGDP